MDASLIRHGYNVERRKMYLENPRHNLKSNVDIVWEQSLPERKANVVERKKQMTNSEIKYQYQRAVNKKIEDEMKMNKSTFRVMPAEYSPPKQKFEDSLHHEINHYENAKKSIVESRNQSVHKKQSLSKSVFGYDISPETFRKQSYLSMVLGDKLAPFLQKEKADNHKSLAINHPVNLKY